MRMRIIGTGEMIIFALVVLAAIVTVALVAWRVSRNNETW